MSALHLTARDYTVQPWANGRGTTTELLRRTAPDGTLLLRLSMATVAEAGPFSVFPGIARVLTVINGPGFTLRGDGLHLRANPLVPVAFDGDREVTAGGVGGVSVDLNVMSTAYLPRPLVRVDRAGTHAARTLVLFALDPLVVGGRTLARHDLLVTDEAVQLDGRALVVRLGYAI